MVSYLLIGSSKLDVKWLPNAHVMLVVLWGMYHLGSKVSLGGLGTCSRRATMVGMINGKIVYFGRAEMKSLLESFFACQRIVDVLACREHGDHAIASGLLCMRGSDVGVESSEELLQRTLAVVFERFFFWRRYGERRKKDRKRYNVSETF